MCLCSFWRAACWADHSVRQTRLGSRLLWSQSDCGPCSGCPRTWERGTLRSSGKAWEGRPGEAGPHASSRVPFSLSPGRRPCCLHMAPCSGFQGGASSVFAGVQLCLSPGSLTAGPTAGWLDTLPPGFRASQRTAQTSERSTRPHSHPPRKQGTEHRQERTGHVAMPFGGGTRNLCCPLWPGRSPGAGTVPDTQQEIHRDGEIYG